MNKRPGREHGWKHRGFPSLFLIVAGIGLGWGAGLPTRASEGSGSAVPGTHAVPPLGAPVPAVALDPGLPSLGSLLWSTTVTLRMSGGYHDNPRLSALNAAGSGYVSGGGDLMVMRLPVDGHEASAYVSLDHRGYFERGFAPETLASADVRYTRTWAGGWSAGTSIEYLFLKQVFDASEIEGVPAVLLTEGQSLTARPVLGRQWSGVWRTELETEWTRQWLADPLDGYRDLAPRLTLIRNLGTRRTLSVSYRIRARSFDERGPLDASGVELPETLQYRQHEVEVAWRHVWGKRQQWRSALRPGWIQNVDNGSGFFDYDRVQVAATVRYVDPHWEARIDGRVRGYRYPSQPGPGGDTTARRRTDVNLTVRGDWKVRPWVRIFLQYELDQSEENRVAADFRAHVMGGGVELEM